MSPSVAVLGGGVGGLSAAHELVERGFSVTVYESRGGFGGKSRSIPVPGSASAGRADLPAEHGFRFFPGFYRHLPDTMSRIPGRGRERVSDDLAAAEAVMIAVNGSSARRLRPLRAARCGGCASRPCSSRRARWTGCCGSCDCRPNRRCASPRAAACNRSAWRGGS